MNKFLVTLIFVFLLSTPLVVVKAETVINNSVSVSANGNTSNIKIKTVNNSETVEDIEISTSTPIYYKSNYQNQDSEIIVSTQTSNNIDEDSKVIQLKLLLDQLQKLLAYYEKLSSEQNF